jgi:FkbM family methyltransferase
MWGRVGKAPGWHYEAMERLGPLLGEENALSTELVNGCRVQCDLRDHVQRHIYLLGCYEPVETYIFTQLLRPGMVVVDAGANVGQYTLLAATAVGPKGQVHSFEPVPDTFGRLRRHVVANNLVNVHLNQAALWYEPTELRLSLAAEARDNKGAYSVGIRNSGAEVVSKAVRLDDYLAALGTDGPHLIKMDIEGAELLALRGMADTLRRRRPLLLMEINSQACARLNYDVKLIEQLLVSELGYRAWAIGNSSSTCHPLETLSGIQQQNLIFHQKDLPAGVTNEWDLKSVLRWARGRAA